MGNLIERAFSLAMDLHGDQVRKASIVPNVPYMSHLTEVAGMVWANLGESVPNTEMIVAAALLHDAIEDQPFSSPRTLINRHCSPEVLALVEELTEIGTDGPKKAPWTERKVAYLDHIQQISTAALLIAVCDKLQSARELRRQVRRIGIDAYEHLGTGEALPEHESSFVWFQISLAEAFQTRLDTLSESIDGPIIPAIQALIEDFKDVVEILKERENPDA